MKKVCISFLALAIIILITAGYIAARGEKPTTEYLRIHIRADSNSDADQNVKYKVKDAVVEFLTPYLAACDTREKADETIKTLIPRIERVAD